MARVLLTLILVNMVSLLMAKGKNGIIMTIDNEEIPTEEFLYLYQKNNNQQEIQQSLDEYLQLFEIYRLKVAEAKLQGKDTVSSFKKEVRQYKRELLEPYITDTVFINSLVDIAYNREKEEVESSHIMLIKTNDALKDKKNLELLDSIRQEIINGADFIELAKTYSQDKFSSQKGGYLGYTPAGTFPYAFETAVYETPEGEISPIITSHVGYHIVKPGHRKLIEEFNLPQKSYEDVKKDLLRKIASPFDPRFFEIRANTVKNLHKKYPELNIDTISSEAAYSLLINKEEDSQYASNSEYRNLVDEFYNGSLLYEISVDNIWDKAANDTEGLEKYYNENKEKYIWDKPHAKGILIRTLNDSVAGVIKEQLKTLPKDSIIPYISENFKKKAIAENFNLPEGSNEIIDELVFEGKERPDSGDKLTHYMVADVRIVEYPEGLQDVKGAVINDYQDILEQEWIANLRQKHSISVNEKELSKVRKKSL